MFSCKRLIISASLSLLLGAPPARADALHCQSINGNLNCVGSHGVSCQQVDGHKVCTSGHGDVVQSFGTAPSSTLDDALEDALPPAMQAHPPGQRHRGAAPRLPENGLTSGDD